MNKLAIFGSVISEEYYSIAQEIIEKLQSSGFEIEIFEDFEKHLKENKVRLPAILSYNEENFKSADIVLCLGGDGTFLKCTHTFYKYNIPILGINLGKLGFLAEILPQQIQYFIENIRNKKYTILHRTLLDFTTVKSKDQISGICLNEITLQKSNNLKLIKLNITINNDSLYSFWADGVIISTPTGSTAYSLSLGGPIITPDSKTLLITPIAPHSLNVRPIIIPDTSVITIEASGDFTNYLISNDFKSVLINEPPKITIKKSKYSIQTIQFHEISFFDILRTKLQLGIDSRK